MTDKINGYGRTEPPVSRSRTGGVKPADQGEAARGAGPDKARADEVALTDTAVRLKRIEQDLAALPEVDQARVDALREQIESGSYEVSGKAIADRLLRLEQDIA